MSGAVPELRFPEFSEAWLEKKLDGFFEEFRKKSTRPDQYEVMTSSRSGLVMQRDYYGEGRITDRDNVGFNIIPPKYLTYRSRSDDRRFFFNENNTGVTGIISIYYPVFRVKNGRNIFFTTLLKKKQDYIGRYSVGTSQTVLSFSELTRIKLPIPEDDEQEKIGSFLESIDVKLTALRDKADALRQFKTGLMQKLFSQELRFTREDGSDFPEWESGRLSDIAQIIGGGTPDSTVSEYWNGDIPWFTPAEIKTKYLQKSIRRISGSGLKNSSAKMLPTGSLILSTRATVGEVGISSRPCATNQGFQSLVVHDRQHNEFWYYWIRAHKHKFLRNAAGSTFLEIGKSEVQKIDVLIPCFDEQRKIADALSAVDSKIDAVTDQITHMEAFKKGLLQKMFV